MNRHKVNEFEAPHIVSVSIYYGWTIIMVQNLGQSVSDCEHNAKK